MTGEAGQAEIQGPCGGGRADGGARRERRRAGRGRDLRPVQPAARRGRRWMVRAARPTVRRAPLAFVPLATLAVAFLAIPLVGPDRAHAVAAPAEPTSAPPACWRALRLSLVCSVGAVAVSAADRCPARLAAGPRALPRQQPGTCAGHPADGAAAGRRRRGAAAGLRPQRSGRPVARSRLRPHAAVHHRRRDHGRGLRCHAVPDHHRRGRPAGPRASATRTPPPRSAPATGPRSGGSPCH